MSPARTGAGARAGAGGGALMRLRDMVRNESLQILRDPSSIAIAFVMPVVLLLLFGYGVSLDANQARITAGYVQGAWQS